MLESHAHCFPSYNFIVNVLLNEIASFLDFLNKTVLHLNELSTELQNNTFYVCKSGGFFLLNNIMSFD